MRLVEDVNAGSVSCFEEDTGFQAAAASASWSANWPGSGSVETPLALPSWDDTDEQLEHKETMLAFHSQLCRDFQAGHCSQHRPKGKTSPCFFYHFESQHRRPPVDLATGRLLYWDVPCHSMSTESTCPNENDCIFAHSQEEISYHPAKYKTRRCNGRGCRGEAVCCFAHTDAELRNWAPERYSYWTFVSGGPVDWSGAGSLDWKVMMSGSRGSNPALSDDLQRTIYNARPQIPATRHKQRFCASYPDVSQCRRGAACAFAHSREEARTPLLSVEEEQQDQKALTDEFFMHRFKTLWCPIGVQHDWQTCVYAHNYQDARRQVSIGYGPRPCPMWGKNPSAEYSQRCPLGLRCPYSHGAKEQLYHPQYFRTVICRDLRMKACPRQKLCAFFHRRAERRGLRQVADNTNYQQPLPQEALPAAWVADFLSPPFRDAAPPPGNGDNPELGPEEEEGNYWCPGYGDQAEEDTGRHIQSDVLQMNRQDYGYSNLMFRLSMYDELNAGGCDEVIPVKPVAKAEVMETDLAEEASTSEGSLVTTDRADRGYPGDAVESGGHLDGASPWKVPIPSYGHGPFGGAFDAFPGFLITAGLATSDPQ